MMDFNSSIFGQNTEPGMMGPPTESQQQPLSITDQATAARQKMMADKLRAMGGKSPQGTMVQGHYVAPSATEQLTPLFASLASAYKGG